MDGEALAAPFRVGITRDLLKPDGTLGPWAVGLDRLREAPGVEAAYLDDDTRELRPDQVRGCDALAVFSPRVSAASLAGADRLAVVARLGVGYDNVDVAACTRQGVAVTITPDGVRRPLASAMLALVLALAHRLPEKERLVRTGRWDDRLDVVGVGLAGRALGLIGLGNVGRDFLRLAAPLGMRHLAHDPFASLGEAAAAGAELVELATLLRVADVVVVACSLTPDTRHLLDAERLALMKPTALLVNAARGPIVDQAALTAALRAGRLAGAGLDVFAREPIDPADPLLALPNVIVSPHSLCWTDECLLATGRSAAEAILAVAAGREPGNVVDREVLETPSFRAKLRNFTARPPAVPAAVGG